MIRRTVDIVCSIVAILLLFPLVLFVGILIQATIGSPVIFRQKRPGKNEKSFVMIKFRTMKNEHDPSCSDTSDAERMTPIGKFLRATSIDELPELWNVLCGDMSIVGPRPLLIEYLPLYSTHQARRHEVKPGITGWAQVNGRNAISWEEKFELDVWYVDNRSLWLDLVIINKSIWKVLFRSDIGAVDHATMEPFKGSMNNE